MNQRPARDRNADSYRRNDQQQHYQSDEKAAHDSNDPHFGPHHKPVTS
jgi:hypothetical protein